MRPLEPLSRPRCALGATLSFLEPSSVRRVLLRSVGSKYGGRDEACPVSTGGGTRRVQLVRGAGRGGSRSYGGERGGWAWGAVTTGPQLPQPPQPTPPGAEERATSGERRATSYELRATSDERRASYHHESTLFFDPFFWGLGYSKYQW